MNINIENMRHSWWEDEQGNVLDLEKYQSPTESEKEKYKFYHSCFPCQISHEISVYDYHLKGIYRKLMKLPIVGRKIKKKNGKTFRHLGTFNTTYRGMSDCIVAMVNSGEYTLEQAIWICANACERCMNVLCYKYLEGKEGYAEYSEEWRKCNTECDFCKVKGGAEE